MNTVLNLTLVFNMVCYIEYIEHHVSLTCFRVLVYYLSSA